MSAAELLDRILDEEQQRAEDERRAQGLPPRLTDPAAQSRILTAMRAG